MNERLRKLRKALNMNQTNFGARVGLTTSAVSDIERGKVKTITESNIKLIAKEFDVNEEWLRSGDGEMFKDFNEDEELGAYVTNLMVNPNNPFSDLIIEMMRIYYELDPMSQKVFDDAIRKLSINMGKKQ